MKTLISQGGTTLRRRVRYEHKRGALGCRYGALGAAQGMSRIDRSCFLPADVVMTSLVAQVVLLLDFGVVRPEYVLALWMTNTEQVRE